MTTILLSAFFTTNPLATFKWQYRVLVVSGTSHDSFVDSVVADNSNIRERKLFIVDIINQKTYPDRGMTTDFYRLASKSLSLTDGEIILIGFDGGIKLRQYEVLTALDLYAMIDAMPMRQHELSRERSDSLDEGI